MRKTGNLWQKMSIMLLALLMIFTIKGEAFAAVTAGDLANPVVDTATHYKGGEHKTTYHYVYFGYYPQKEMLGGEITDIIRNAPYDENGDAVAADGKKYRRLTYNMKTVTGTINKTTEKTWLEQSDKGSGYRYFLYEPIRWRILKNENNTLFLMSDMTVDVQHMHRNNNAGNTWETFDLRTWLNYDGTKEWDPPYPFFKSKGFLKYAFNEEEQNKIKVTHVVQDENPEYGTKSGNDTQDKIFLLGCSEIMNSEYGFCNIFDLSVGRYACDRAATHATDYAIALGRFDKEQMEYPVWSYWLRTKGESLSKMVDIFNRTKALGTQGGQPTMYNGVVPALNVNYNLSDCIRVNFETNGAGSIEEQIFLGSSYVKEPPVLTKENYVFCGWYEDKACTIPYEFNRPLTKDTTLYASWKQYKKVSFETNGAGSIEAQTILEGNKVTKPADPVKAGYIFTGWYTDKACTAAYDFNAGVTADTTLYAGWKIEPLKKNATFTAGGKKYKVTSAVSKTVEYKGLTSSKAKRATSITIPSTVSCKGVTYKVTAVGKDVCKNYKKLKKVTIGKYVTKIGDTAFYGCSKLTTVTFKGSKVTKIGARAFKKCGSLKSISLPKDLKEIGKEAFRDCKKLSKITFKGTAFKKAGKNCFKNIYKKATFKVPKKKYKSYQKIIKKNTGYKSSMKIKK